MNKAVVLLTLAACGIPTLTDSREVGAISRHLNRGYLQEHNSLEGEKKWEGALMGGLVGAGTGALGGCATNMMMGGGCTDGAMKGGLVGGATGAVGGYVAEKTGDPNMSTEEKLKRGAMGGAVGGAVGGVGAVALTGAGDTSGLLSSKTSGAAPGTQQATAVDPMTGMPVAAGAAGVAGVGMAGAGMAGQPGMEGQQSMYGQQGGTYGQQGMYGGANQVLLSTAAVVVATLCLL